MKKSFVSFCTLTLFLFLVNCGSPEPPPPVESELRGQVFIVTQGAANFKLGLVEVKAIDEQQMLAFIADKRQAAAAETNIHKSSRDVLNNQLKPLEEEFIAAERSWKRKSTSFDLLEKVNAAEKRIKAKKAEIAKLDADFQKYYRGGYWIMELPVPLQAAKTDADGNFVLRLKPGRHALVADASRKVLDKTEEYFWLVWIDVKPESNDRIFLSNDNLLETFCAQCIIRPEDILVFPK